ncbi:hypothetical protein JAAARDRAFT_51943 [Jaapia argillacea MUCL 33604]|uniref:Uncharacterized protein n=1 Tax=Jaapia argillacea MUCL 33604 TaxID=933084 RepID=A0A067P201_9AGAM|nr:hypothetical protein JAAARDRAFT_51943 [Jaapia argillacea MUCL 33604]
MAEIGPYNSPRTPFFHSHYNLRTSLEQLLNHTPRTTISPHLLGEYVAYFQLTIYSRVDIAIAAYVDACDRSTQISDEDFEFWCLGMFAELFLFRSAYCNAITAGAQYYQPAPCMAVLHRFFCQEQPPARDWSQMFGQFREARGPSSPYRGPTWSALRLWWESSDVRAGVRALLKATSLEEVDLVDSMRDMEERYLAFKVLPSLEMFPIDLPPVGLFRNPSDELQNDPYHELDHLVLAVRNLLMDGGSPTLSPGLPSELMSQLSKYTPDRAEPCFADGPVVRELKSLFGEVGLCLYCSGGVSDCPSTSRKVSSWTNHTVVLGKGGGMDALSKVASTFRPITPVKTDVGYSIAHHWLPHFNEMRSL